MCNAIFEGKKTIEEHFAACKSVDEEINRVVTMENEGRKGRIKMVFCFRVECRCEEQVKKVNEICRLKSK